MNATTLSQTCTTYTLKDQEIARLRADLESAYHDPIWNIYSRQGIERRMPYLDRGMAVIVIDIDRMHDANAAYTHGGVDWRLRQILAGIRSDDTLIGRWKQGDELVIFVRLVHAAGLAQRLSAAFLAHGMSMTAAIVSNATHVGIAAGIARIETAKLSDGRGRVYVCAGGLA